MTITAMPDTAAAVLGAARERRRIADRAEAELLEFAVQWAVLHPAESIETGAATYRTRSGDETDVVLAGAGAPLVAEFAVMEFAAAMGMTTDGGKHLLGEALELRYRLPRVWERVRTGRLVGWRGRRIASRTMVLSPGAAAFVDSHVAPVAHKIRPYENDRLVDEAFAQLMPQAVIQDMRDSWETRRVTLHGDQVMLMGTMAVSMELDLADAMDFDAAVSEGAARLAELGSTAPLDARRAMAVGEMARHQLALDLTSGELSPTPLGSTTRSRARRNLVLHVHLSDAALASSPAESSAPAPLPLGRLENGDHVVTAEQVRAWCGVPGTHVVVKPVIDLHDRIRVNQYEIPVRIAEHVVLRDGTCVFPWCTRPARGCDLDHVVPHGTRGGPTATDNLAPLCRRHHRLKTHGGWTYSVIEPGSYLWSTPRGHHFLRDPIGTTDVSADVASVRSRGAPPDS